MPTLFRELEAAGDGRRVALNDALAAIPFNADGLIPAIAQDADTNRVLMLAWMNRTAIETTLRDGYATYFSRSRNALWRKGETSGHLQSLVSAHLDCDGDALLLRVRQTGPACHTNRPACFYLRLSQSGLSVEGDAP
ncbi:MAG: phosphoribosyl-AMP cyclohydrolase [Pseudomonadales bacterium]|nr:phosphoribosyl-AMP cyclohydrolase [Pseudomonadales bacterium]MCP5185912.1 phosphoribosyl-AMP cyclohydrolase [Pseudomonadales bacterium]